MGIRFGDPSAPAYVGTWIFHVGIVAGFLIVFAACVVADKIGSMMYLKGYARPFYIKGHRIHHALIYAIIPACYVIMAVLVLMGRFQLVQSLVWYRLASLVPLVAACVAVDFLGDGTWLSRLKVVRGHEWVYALIPLYLVSFVLNVYL